MDLTEWSRLDTKPELDAYVVALQDNIRFLRTELSMKEHALAKAHYKLERMMGAALPPFIYHEDIK